MQTKTNVKAGGSGQNHNQSGMAVTLAVKAGGLNFNHKQSVR
jgi:hypothetical protein